MKRPAQSMKKFLAKLFSKSFEKSPPLKKGGTQKLLLFFISAGTVACG
ncbi:hypothetical protein [Komagataeibacter diospyri]